jgi:hypothetical protein
MRNPFRYFNSSPEIIHLTVMMYVRYPLSLRQVEDLLFERGINICQLTLTVPRAALNFRDTKTLQKFASIHTSIHNHFNLERHLNRRETFKQNRAAAMAEWRQLAA